MAVKQSKIYKYGLSAISKLIKKTRTLDNEIFNDEIYDFIIKELIFTGWNLFPYQAEVKMSKCNLIKRMFELLPLRTIDSNQYE